MYTYWGLKKEILLIRELTTPLKDGFRRWNPVNSWSRLRGARVVMRTCASPTYARPLIGRGYNFPAASLAHDLPKISIRALSSKNWRMV